VQRHTWLDILHGLPSAREVTTGDSFWVTLIDVLICLLRRDIGFDDARGNSKIGRLLSDALGKASRVPPN
jgi:hypothetical protein